jgi:hypothetical protein
MQYVLLKYWLFITMCQTAWLYIPENCIFIAVKTSDPMLSSVCAVEQPTDLLLFVASSARVQNQQAGRLLYSILFQDATILHCLLVLHVAWMQTLATFRSGLLVLLVLGFPLSHTRNNLFNLGNFSYALKSKQQK